MASLEVVRHLGTGNLAVHLIHSLDELIRQGTLLDHVQVGIQLRGARNADDDTVAVLGREIAVIDGPSQSRAVAADATLGDEIDRFLGRSLDIRLDIRGRVHLPQRKLQTHVSPFFTPCDE